MSSFEQIPEDWEELMSPGRVTVQHAGLLTYGDISIRLLDLAASRGKSVLFFSLGRSERSVAADLLCCRAGLELGEENRRVFSEQELEKLMRLGKQLHTENLHIDDSEDLDLAYLEKSIAVYRTLDLVIIDSIELMDSPMKTDGRIKGFARLLGQLKLLSRKMRVPIVAFRRPAFFVS